MCSAYTCTCMLQCPDRDIQQMYICGLSITVHTWFILHLMWSLATVDTGELLFKPLLLHMELYLSPLPLPLSLSRSKISLRFSADLARLLWSF